MPAQPAFAPVFTALTDLLRPHAHRLVVVQDSARVYCLDAAPLAPGQKPVFFAAVRLGQSYVAYILNPVELYPALLAGLTPALRRRLRGQRSFNFKAVEAPLFTELAALTHASLAQLTAAGLLR